MTKKNKKGFTLTELIVVIAIIAILAAVLIPTSISFIQKAKLSNDKQTATQMTKLMSYYMIENDITSCDIHVLYDALESSNNSNLSLDASAKGYTFWLDIEEAVVFVGKTDETLEGTVSAAVSETYISENTIEAVSVNQHWLYLDTDEKEPVTKAIKYIYNMSSSLNGNDTDYTDLTNKIENESVKNHLNNFKPSNTLIICDQSMYIPSTISKVVFVPGINIIPTNAENKEMHFESNPDEPTMKVNIPQTVNKVNNNAFTKTNDVIIIASQKLIFNSQKINNNVTIINAEEASGVQIPKFTINNNYNWIESVNNSLVTRTSGYSFAYIGKADLKYLVMNPEIAMTNKTIKEVYDNGKGITSLELKRVLLNNQVIYTAYAFDAKGKIVAISNSVGYFTDVIIDVIPIVVSGSTTYKLIVKVPYDKLNNIDTNNIHVYYGTNEALSFNSDLKYYYINSLSSINDNVTVKYDHDNNEKTTEQILLIKKIK